MSEETIALLALLTFILLVSAMGFGTMCYDAKKRVEAAKIIHEQSRLILEAKKLEVEHGENKS